MKTFQSSTASPTPQSVFTESPRTNIIDGDEEADRAALLPELHRALSQVNTLLGELTQRGRQDEQNGLDELLPTSFGMSGTESRLQRSYHDLPWMARAVERVDDCESDDDDYETPGSSEAEELVPISSNYSNIEEPDEDGEAANETSSSFASEQHQASFGPAPRQMYNRSELRNLATLLDRLGRTLTDAAPHVASLAASLPEQAIPASNQQQNAPELDSVQELETPPAAPLGGLLSLWSRERRRQNAINENAETPASNSIDPDHVDYASGLVNTTRGEVRSGPRSRSSGDDVANILGAYLAAASLGGLASTSDDDDDETAGLGRLLARGGGTGGIDIHIHAVVTTGGAGTGVVGIGGGIGGRLGGGGGGGVVSPTATLTGGNARSIFSSSRGIRSNGSILRSRNTTSNIPEPEEDNDDLFSELYSENPTPIDPNGSPGPGDPRSNDDSSARVRSSPNRDFSSIRSSFDDQSYDFTPPARRNRSENPPRRQSSERRSGVFRLFRRRSRNQNSSRHFDNTE